MRNYTHPKATSVRLTDILFALSDPTRLSFVVALYRHGSEYTPGEMRELGGGISKSTVTHHNKSLREAGLTRTRTEGTRCYVSLRTADLEARFPGLLPMLVRHSEETGAG
jgi:DNA-binding transcriptional ArsR family regulator